MSSLLGPLGMGSETKALVDKPFQLLGNMNPNQKLFDSDSKNAERFIGESGMSKEEFLVSDPTDISNRFNQWKVGKADQAYLDTKTALLAAPGRKANLLADPIQGMGKLLGKSVL